MVARRPVHVELWMQQMQLWLLEHLDLESPGSQRLI